MASSCARRSRRGRPSSSPATWPSTAASRSARTCSSLTPPSALPPGGSWRRSTRCRASSEESASARESARAALFSVFAAPIVQTTPVQAELAKIWTNILRYTQFALPNLLMMDCEQYGANVFDVIDLINRDYPRGGMASPGLTAGTCLRKDFAFSEEKSNAPGMLLGVSRVNESVPLFLVQGMTRRLGSLNGRKVAVLGLAFKRDTDDERDSLAHKLVRLLERELADVVDPRPARRVADHALRGDRPGRRRRRRGDQPLRVQPPRDARGPAAAGASRLPGGRSLERLRRRPGLRVRERDRGPRGGAGRATPIAPAACAYAATRRASRP